jgi:7-alpha-hydroxysteroid dehydrogenase
MGLLDGKVAIITGASKGIGRALSLCFARENAAVICAARSTDLVRETSELVQKAGGRAIAVTCDAAREDDVQRMVEAGVKAFGSITTLINNAGDGGPTKPVEEYTMYDCLYSVLYLLSS